MISTRCFQKALAVSADDRLFENIPVDWWDVESNVWRPSVLEAALRNQHAPRTHATIAMPDSRNRVVHISDLRPSQLLNEDLVQFYTTRYTLEILDSLQPCIELASSEEREQLQDVIDELWEIFRETGKVWEETFVQGCQKGIGHWLDEFVDDDWERAPLFEDKNVVQAIAAIGGQSHHGEINCSPVVLWDEVARIWRPTLMLGATGEQSQFEAWQEIRVLVPAEPVDVTTVPGSYLQPTEIADSCFSVFAIPVVARDLLRMHEALNMARWTPAEIARHPSIVALMRMLEGAAGEWRTVYEAGLSGPAPEPRITPIDPSLWGLSTEGYTPVSDEA